MILKKYRTKVFCGNLLPEVTPEWIVEAQSEVGAKLIAMSMVNPRDLVYFEFVEAVEI